MAAREIPDWVDQSLVFWQKGEVGRCFFVGNSHTYPGRMGAYSEELGLEFSVSKFEIERISEKAEAWMEGFLFGNEPKPPSDQDLPAYSAWLQSMEEFHSTGRILPADPASAND